MSFVKSMKRAFGFGADDTDEYVLEETEETDPVTEEETPAVVNAPLQSEPACDETDELPLAIFDGVIAVFNAAQPDFIKSCLDVEAQRRYLYQAMDSSLKEYMARIGETTRQKAMQSWGEERTRLQDQLQELQKLQRRATEHQAEQQQQKLSAQRQKRALNDRIRELEKRVMELEAEREQFELQTKSLANKLKVADVKDADLTAQRDEIASLKDRLRQAEEIIRQKEDQLKTTTASALPADELQAMKEIEERLAQFEEIKRRKDEQIETQAAMIAGMERDMAVLQDQLLQVQTQLQEQMAAQTAASRKEGEKPRRRQRKDDGSATAKRRSKVKISAIDENLDGIEWLLSTPGEDETVSKAVASAASDSDFGYQPPARKEIVDNDAQLSLF